MRSAIGKYGAILVKPFASCGTSHPLGIIDGMQAAESSAVDGMATADDDTGSIDAIPTELAGVDPNVLLVDVGVVVLEL